MLNQEVASLFAAEHITHAAVLPFEALRVTQARLYERAGLVPKSAVIFLIPYFSGEGENLSSYAVAEDYHFYAERLYERLCGALKERFPEASFLGFADHSPIDERDAATRAGLGIWGKNRLLISPDFGTYQFIGEILSDLSPEVLGTPRLHAPTLCIGCGACLSACPTGILRGESTECLSAITQKKGALSEDEMALMRRTGTAWGCDECQRVCPYTREAVHTGTAISPIPFFHENRITRLTTAQVSAMDEDTFRRRAFAWRGRSVVLRNTAVLEEEKEK